MPPAVRDMKPNAGPRNVRGIVDPILAGSAIRLRQLFDTGSFSDITVTFGKNSWKLHKAILVWNSGYFASAQKFHEGSQSAISLDGLKDLNFAAGAIETCLKAAYGFELDQSQTNYGVYLARLYNVAEYLQMDTLLADIQSEFLAYASHYKTHQAANLLDCAQVVYNESPTRALKTLLVGALRRDSSWRRLPQARMTLTGIPELAADLVLDIQRGVRNVDSPAHPLRHAAAFVETVHVPSSSNDGSD